MTQNDLGILDELLERTENLPDILHLRAGESNYEFTDLDKQLLSEAYQKLDLILKELASFINIKFPKVSRHIKAWNNIDFDTKVGDFKIVTTDREHIKRAWNTGMFDLISLIKVLRSETLLLIDENDQTISTDQNRNTINNFQGNIIYNEYSTNSHQKVTDRGNHNLDTEPKTSWIEIASWIAGILGVGITIHQLFK